MKALFLVALLTLLSQLTVAIPFFSSGCQVLNSPPKYKDNTFKNSKIITSDDNKIALQILGHLVYKSKHLNGTSSDKYVPLNDISKITTEKSYFEIIKLETPCADIELYISNSSVFKKMSLVSIDIVKLKTSDDIKFKNKRQRGDCNFKMLKEVRRSRFKNAFDCPRNLDLSCPASSEEEINDGEHLADLQLKGLKIEFNRPKNADRNAFVTNPESFTHCKDAKDADKIDDIDIADLNQR